MKATRVPGVKRMANGRWRPGVSGLSFLLLAAVAGAVPLEPLRVALIAGAEPSDAAVPACLERLRAGLQAQPHTTVSVVVSPAGSGQMPSLAVLRAADAAVLYGGSGTLSAADAALLREFLQQGRGLLVVRETTRGWTAWPDFAANVLGGKSKGRFARGEPMRVINLLGHAVFTGVARLETQQEMPLYEDLPPDVMLVAEGTVGEETAPLAWLRHVAGARVAHVLPSEPALFRNPDFQRFLANTVQWLARRPIPGARALVQRTYLPDAYPGAIAITFPDGPTVCFDPTRGGVSQVTTGDFVDLRPRWLTKRGEPARMFGEPVFQDAGREAFWRAGSEAGPAFRFKGYRVRHEYPEFHYRIGDRDVREIMRPGEAGPAGGLVCELHIGPGRDPLRYEHDASVRGALVVRGATATARGFSYDSTEPGVVTIERKAATP